MLSYYFPNFSLKKGFVLRNRINLKINVTTIEYSLFVIWVTKNGMWVGSVSRYQAPKPGFRLGGDAPGS